VAHSSRSACTANDRIRWWWRDASERCLCIIQADAHKRGRQDRVNSGRLGLGRNVRALLRLLSCYAGYAFDDTDWQTVVLGLEGTDDDQDDGWYSYPLVGHHHLNVALANSMGNDVVSVRIDGLTDYDMALRAETLLDAYAQMPSS
jgi:hypothetical protein